MQLFLLCFFLPASGLVVGQHCVIVQSYTLNFGFSNECYNTPLRGPVNWKCKINTLNTCLFFKVNKSAKIRNRYNQVPHLTQDTNGKVTNSQLDTTNESQEVSPLPAGDHKAHIDRRAQIHSKHKTEKNP